MKTNELKKNDKIILKNGWEAIIADNKQGNIRLAKVFGQYTELGSIYSHNINYYVSEEGIQTKIRLTPAQLKFQKKIKEWDYK